MGITKYCYAALFLKVRFEERQKKWKKNVSTGAVVWGLKKQIQNSYEVSG